LAWLALVANLVECMLGFVTDPQPALVRISHSLLGQVFFSTTVAIAVFTCKAGRQTPEPVRNAELLRFVAIATPALVFSQVALGVLLRHGVIGAVPHILWAFVVAIYLVPVVAAIFNTGHSEIRRAGVAFAVVAAMQVLIGFALFIMQSLDIDPVVLIVVTAVHATTAAFTIAAAVVMAIVIRGTLRACCKPQRERTLSACIERDLVPVPGNGG
jgi:heme A synthase